MKRSLALLSSLALTFTALGCSGGTEAGPSSAATASAEADLLAGRSGAVFTLSNDPQSNDVLAYRRAADGTLQRAASFSTTGRGSGDGLGSQGALTLSLDRRWLFAVSAGSNELAVFRVDAEQLTLVSTVATGGVRPVSVTEHGGLVYVLHAGDGANDVTGFVQRPDGSLARLSGSTRSLSAGTVGPAQIAFSPSGRALIVTEKMTNLIDELRVDPQTGLVGQVSSIASSGQTPFGFSVTQRGQVIVSEAFGGADNASAMSSYQLGRSAELLPVSRSVPDTESAACWVVLAKDDRLAFTTNTKTGSVSTFEVSSQGELRLLAARAADTGVGSKPTDIAASRHDRYLYVLESGTASIGALRIEADGALTPVGTLGGLPLNATGLAAF